MDFDLLSIVLIATFMSQLVLLSIVGPRRVYLYRRELWEKFPPEQYSHLYPVGMEWIQRQQSISRVIDWGVFCTGFLILIVLVIRSSSTGQMAYVMSCVCIAQVLARVVRERIDFKIMRAYKSMAPPAVRTAIFQSWTLWNFVSPALVVCGIVTTTIAIVVASLVGFMPQGKAAVILVYLAMDLFLLVRMVRVIFQPLLPRPDPYATKEDVFAIRKRRLHVLFIGSAIFAIITTFELLAGTKLIELRYEYVTVAVSLIIQATSVALSAAILRQLRTRDFSAYRGSAAATN